LFRFVGRKELIAQSLERSVIIHVERNWQKLNRQSHFGRPSQSLVKDLIGTPGNLFKQTRVFPFHPNQVITPVLGWT
jgi:hypothetical protein